MRLSVARQIYDSLTSEDSLEQRLCEPEGLHLDYKSGTELSGDGLSKGTRSLLGKALSGFANAEGGVLIFGVDEIPDEDTGEKIRTLNPISDINRVLERIREQIPRSTQFEVQGVGAKAIGTSQDSDSGYIAIYCPSSDLAPHRSNTSGQREYYQRIGESFIPMEHYQIADIFGRRHGPEMAVVIYPAYRWQGPRPGAHHFSLHIGLQNRGRGIAKYPLLRIAELPRHWANPTLGFDGQGRHGLTRRIAFGATNRTEFIGTSDQVIHSGATQEITLVHRKYDIDPVRETWFDRSELVGEIALEVAAEGYPLKTFKVAIPIEQLYSLLKRVWNRAPSAGPQMAGDEFGDAILIEAG